MSFAFRVSREQVKGVLCVDESGLNVCSRGTLSNAAGDAAVDLLKLASSLEPNLPTVIEFTGFSSIYFLCSNEGKYHQSLNKVPSITQNNDSN